MLTKVSLPNEFVVNARVELRDMLVLDEFEFVHAEETEELVVEFLGKTDIHLTELLLDHIKVLRVDKRSRHH
jgi:hypothetical protein